MILNRATIETYKELLFSPGKLNLPYKPFPDCFAKTLTVTASHILYRDYVRSIDDRPLPKLIFYIIMQETFGFPSGKDATGDLGYHLQVTQ